MSLVGAGLDCENMGTCWLTGSQRDWELMWGRAPMSEYMSSMKMPALTTVSALLASMMDA